MPHSDSEDALDKLNHVAPQNHAESTPGLLSVLDGALALVRYRRAVACWTALGLLAGIGATFLPKSYTAEVSTLPPQSSSSGLASQLEGLSSLGGAAGLSGMGGMRSNQDLYVALLQTANVQRAFAERFNLQTEYHTNGWMQTRKALKKHLEVDGSGKDGLIRLDLHDSHPERAAELANGYVQVYQSISRQLAVGEASQRRVFFETQLNEEKDKLTNAEEALRRVEQSSGTVELDAQTRSLIQSAAALRAQVSAKEVQVRAMQTYAAAESPQLMQAQQELASLRAELAKLSSGDTDTAAGLFVPKTALPQAALDYIRGTRELKYHETLFGILSRQYEAARLDEAKEGATLQVVDPAIAPDQPSSPGRIVKVLTGMLIGFVCGCLYVAVHSFCRLLTREAPARERLALLRSTWHHSSGS